MVVDKHFCSLGQVQILWKGHKYASEVQFIVYDYFIFIYSPRDSIK
jgi:hypothetical protein